MRLDRLHIQNFRCYEDATFDFQPGFNLVVGVNGSGKTSLLQAVASSFTDFGATTGNTPEANSGEDVRFVIDTFEGRSRFERRFPLTLKAEGRILGTPQWTFYIARKDTPALTDLSLDLDLDKTLERLENGKTLDLPLLAFYRADRRWIASDVSAESAATHRVSRFDGYKNWFDAATNLKDFESWLIGKRLEQLQKISQSGNPKNGFDDELTWVNSALIYALPDCKGIQYDLNLRSLLVELDAKNKSIPFGSLSDGQRGMVALFADIARRMCILNPHMGKNVLKNTSGVVIIDELDIHLHPAWQRSIVPALKKAFPKVQFIAASHSPQIIGSLKPEEVIVLNDGDPSHPRVTYGLDSSRILEEVMDVAQREPEIEVLLSELFSTLEDNDLEKAKLLLEALKTKAPHLPEFLRAEALLRRKEIIGR
jgi:predicted ATP-binding protein involved in virulence